MTTNIGLWIDHRQAVIVALVDQQQITYRVQSNAEKQLRRTGDTPMYGAHDPQHTFADDKQLRLFMAHLNRYYASISAYLREAKAILIFGPGIAKQELREHLTRNRLGARVVEIAPADKMTARQIVAKVRGYFRAE